MKIFLGLGNNVDTEVQLPRVNKSSSSMEKTKCNTEIRLYNLLTKDLELQLLDKTGRKPRLKRKALYTRFPSLIHKRNRKMKRKKS